MEGLVSSPSFPSSFAFDLPVKHLASQPSVPFPRIAPPKNGFPSAVGPRCVAVSDSGSSWMDLRPLSLAALLPEQTSEEFVTSMEDHLQRLHRKHAVVKRSKRDCEDVVVGKNVPLLKSIDNEKEDESVHDFGSEFDDLVDSGDVDDDGREIIVPDESGCCC